MRSGGCEVTILSCLCPADGQWAGGSIATGPCSGTDDHDPVAAAQVQTLTKPSKSLAQAISAQAKARARPVCSCAQGLRCHPPVARGNGTFRARPGPGVPHCSCSGRRRWPFATRLHAPVRGPRPLPRCAQGAPGQLDAEAEALVVVAPLSFAESLCAALQPTQGHAPQASKAMGAHGVAGLLPVLQKATGPAPLRAVEAIHSNALVGQGSVRLCNQLVGLLS